MSDIKYEIVKGCEKLGYYDIKITKDVKIRFFQIAQFQENGLYAIRSYLFEGNGTNTGCFYEYKPVEMNALQITLGGEQITQAMQIRIKQENRQAILLRKNNGLFSWIANTAP